MKKLLFTLGLISVYVGGNAQVVGAPQLINYQAIARDVVGTVITTPIGVQFEILQGLVPVYTETQTVTPSSAGIFTAAIGSGPGVGTFSTITWGLGSYNIRVSIDPAGGNVFVLTGTHSLLSVPYALYSERTRPPIISYSGTTLSVNGSTVNLPGLAPPNIMGGGITNVNPSGNSFTITTPPTNISAGSGIVVSQFGNSFTVAAAGGTTFSNPSSITINPPHSVTTNTLLNSNTITIASPTINSGGVTVVNPVTGNSFTVSTPPTVLNYNASNGIISYSPTIGANTVNITPNVTFTAGILTIGPLTNSVSIGSVGPWTKPTASVVALTILSDNVGIGTNSPSGRLDVKSSGFVTNYSSSNSSSASYTSINFDSQSSLETGLITNGGTGIALSVQKTGTSIGDALSVINSNPANTSNAIFASTNGTGYTANFFKSGAGPGLITTHSGATGAAGNFIINNPANASSAFSVSTNGSGSAGDFSTSGSGNGIIVQTSGGGAAGNFIKSNSGFGILSSHSGSNGNAGYFSISAVGNTSEALYAQTIGTGDAIRANNTGNGRAIYGTNAGSVMTMQLANTGIGDAISATVASGRVIFAQNTSNAFATIESTNNGTGPVYFGYKSAVATVGSVANFANNSTANGSDAMFVSNNGTGSVIRAVNGPNVAGASNVNVWFDNGHLKSTQSNSVGVNTFSISGGATSISYTCTGCTDVKGNLLAVITTTGLINPLASEVIKITFSKSYTVPPAIVITPTSDFGPMTYFVTNVSSLAFSIVLKNNSGTSIAGNPIPYSFNYFVIE